MRKRQPFRRLNTYDTAGFTFGFFQMAAHVGRDNLLAVLRAMLELPNCARYFPELQLRNGRLHKVERPAGTTNLEATDAKGRFANLIAYLNPGAEMEMQEATQAARFIHWALNNPAFRDVQARPPIASSMRRSPARRTRNSISTAEATSSAASSSTSCIRDAANTRP